MVYSGPQKYPGASLAYWYQDNYGGTRFEANVVVWHTTEGTSVPSYGGGASAPNLTAWPDFSNKRLRWYQHFDIDRSSRALVNRSGGVETNSLNALQIELIGTCDPPTHKKWTDAGRAHIYWPEAPDWALAQLGHMVQWLYVNHRIKKQSTVTWKAYPGSYGATSTRLTNSEWLNYYGHLGHQHVPENSHGDPGSLDFSRVLQLANGDDMALSAAEIDKIAVRNWVKDGFIKAPDPEATNAFWAPASYLRNTYLKLENTQSAVYAASARTIDIETKVDVLTAKVDSLTTGGVDLDLLAEKVADLLAARLAD